MRISILIILFIVCVTSNAQGQYISGTVMSEKEEILPNVTLHLKKSGKYEVTDRNGYFKLPLSHNDTLEVRHIGFETKIIIVAKNSGTIEIKLHENVFQLNEVAVVKVNAEKLVNNIIKNIKKNYSSEYALLSGDYREAVFEDSDFLVENKAKFNLYYSPYQNVIKKRDYTSFCVNMRRVNHLKGAISQFIPYYVSNNDEVEIVSTQFSVITHKPSIMPQGGPLDLVSMDKFKYKDDFLNPNLTHKYNYTVKGDTIINQYNCYVLSFKPKQIETITLFSCRVDKAIYSGELYVDKKTYAVLAYKCQLDNKDVFQEYKYQESKQGHFVWHTFTNQIEISVTYQSFNNQWILEKVKSRSLYRLGLEDSIKNISNYNNQVISAPPYTVVERELVLNKPIPSTTKPDKSKTLKMHEFLCNIDNPNQSIKQISSPVATKKSQLRVLPYDTVFDNYAYLRNVKSIETENYTKSENAYFKQEILNKNKNADNFHLQYNNIVVERDLNAPANSVDNNNKAFVVNSFKSICNTLAIKTTNTDTIYIDNINNFLWYDSTKLFYIQCNKQTQNTESLYVFDIITEKSELIYNLTDPQFSIEIKKTSTGNYFLMNSSSQSESEDYLLQKQGNVFLVKQLTKLVDNEIRTADYFENDFYIIQNAISGNQIVQYSSKKIIYSTPNLILDIFGQNSHILVQEYNVNRPELKLINLRNNNVKNIDLGTDTYSTSIIKNNNQPRHLLQFYYSSFTQPETIIELDINTELTKVISTAAFSGNYNKNVYKTETKTAISADGTEIPITLFYNSEKLSDSSNLLIKAYGAAYATPFFDFKEENIVWADNGYIVAYAHVRGGGEKGLKWYNEGKLLNKKNSFIDYIECVKFLQKSYNIPANKTIGKGTSAGGLIMGYMANNYPEYFGTLIFDRPFLDVLGVMSDNSLPLTIQDYKEYGNPNEKNIYDYMKSYSIYENIIPQKYPNMIFMCNYNDQNTPALQIIPTVAKYKANNLNQTQILLNTGFTYGHYVSFGYLINNWSYEYAFVLNNTK